MFSSVIFSDLCSTVVLEQIQIGCLSDNFEQLLYLHKSKMAAGRHFEKLTFFI